MIDTRAVVERFRTLESLAIVSRLSSTNLVARRIVTECVENDLSLPQAMIIAKEQLAGRGRNERTWSSPRGKGIYATILLTRSVRDLPLIPLEMANIVASFLRNRFDIPAQVKWPNDILVDGRKISGVLTEARIQESRAHLIIGIGVNVEPVTDDDRPNAVSIAELSPRDYRGIDDATEAFATSVDEGLARVMDAQRVLRDWRALTVHRAGDRITCVIGERTLIGTWGGIDDEGRALLEEQGQMIPVSAGEFIAI